MIKQAIEEQIESGQLAPRQKLPAERKLAESFNTTRVTLREALSLLEADGCIYREDRRGWFISPPTLKYDLAQTQSFIQWASSQNRAPQTELLSARSVVANKHASHLLKLPPFSDAYQLDRVRYLEQRPVAYVTNYACPRQFAGLLDHDLTQSLTDVYRQDYGVDFHQVTCQVSTRVLLGDMALALRATVGTPALVVERIHSNAQGERIEAAVEFWRHDAIQIESSHVHC
nr:UTRA domain-containing protein [Vibrio sp. JPW-9-11-11]